MSSLSLTHGRRLGYRADPPDGRDWHVGLMGLSASPPSSASLAGYVDGALDQEDTASCVANAWAQALRIGDHVDGKAAPELSSRLFLYFNARAWHGEEHEDSGTYLRTCAQGLTRFGRAPERFWQFDPERVNDHPPWSLYRSAYDARGPRGYYRIPDGDLVSVKAALAAGKPVVFGMQVDEAFLYSDGPEVIDAPEGPAVGGHALCLVGYDNDTFEFVNSWGDGWRQSGFARLTSRRLRTASDLWAVDP